MENILDHKNLNLFYIDNDPSQYRIISNLLRGVCDIHFFENSMDAIGALTQFEPSIIIYEDSDSIELNHSFIDVVSRICPLALPILSIGYGEEDKILCSEHIDRIFDVIVKPWSKDKLTHTILRALEHNQKSKSLSVLTHHLEEKNNELNKTLLEREQILTRYQEMDQEIRSWVHPFVLRASQSKIKFPLHKDLSLLTIDIIDSSKLHLSNDLGVDLRVKILQTAWEIVLKHGGEIESQEGDKVYANFGLSGDLGNIANAAIAAGREFRSALQALNDHFGTSVEVGIGIHYAYNCKINLRQSAINMDGNVIIRKKFDTSSSDVDLCHRMETLAHNLVGSNIILSEPLINASTIQNIKTIPLGNLKLKGQTNPTNLFIIPSSKVSTTELLNFQHSVSKLFSPIKQSA